MVNVAPWRVAQYEVAQPTPVVPFHTICEKWPHEPKLLVSGLSRP